jgi:hypothetical protein
MTKFIWKFLSLTCICAVFIIIGATDTFAYPTYEGGCVECHPLFQGMGPLHAAHVPTLTTECNSCHLIIGDDPETGYTPTSDTGTGCVGCHGRLEDEGYDSLPDGIGAGLRQHHFNAGIPTCLDCHADSFSPEYTPVSEDVVPTFYPYLSPLALDPCDDGLDNDGDLLADGDDPDCEPAECVPETECSAASECGTEPDGCPGDGTIDCGMCDIGLECVANMCEPETPEIDCACDDDWKNHGQYVRCVAQAAGDLVDAGLISEAEKDDIVMDAAESDCGSKK